MHEVTCFHCGHIAHISPDAERCAVCGADLSHLIMPEYASGYFYDRAAELAAAGEVTLALLEVERGLAYRKSSELNLLGAILAQRLGDLSKVRQYVAHIPVDDALRSEAEWLLRSQQPGQRSPPPLPNGAQTNAPSLSEQVWSANGQRATAKPLAGLQPLRRHELLYGLVAVMLVLLVVWLAVEPLASVVLGLFSAPGALGNATQEPQAAVNPLPAGGESANAPFAEAPVVAIGTEATTMTNSAGIDSTAPITEAVANANAPPTFDLKDFLAQTNRPELAELDVTAVLREGVLILTGVVPLFDQQQSLVELATRIPGVTRVDESGLELQLPPTYVVQEGDTLWLISYKIYGDNRVDQLFNANQDVLTSPETLRVGQELKVPPKE